MSGWLAALAKGRRPSDCVRCLSESGERLKNPSLPDPVSSLEIELLFHMLPARYPVRTGSALCLVNEIARFLRTPCSSSMASSLAMAIDFTSIPVMATINKPMWHMARSQRFRDDLLRSRDRVEVLPTSDMLEALSSSGSWKKKKKYDQKMIINN